VIELKKKIICVILSVAFCISYTPVGLSTGTGLDTSPLTSAFSGIYKIMDALEGTPSGGPAAEKEVDLDEASGNAITVAVNETVRLNIVFRPENATNKRVTWSSDNRDVATVSNNGSVKGIRPGTAVVTVRTEDGSRTATCTITVVHVPVTGIAFAHNHKAQSVEVGRTVTLRPEISPQNASNKNIIWRSSDPTIATVSERGIVTGVRTGVAVITAETEDGRRQDTCEITVTFISVTGITLPEEYAVEVGRTVSVRPTFTPSRPTNNRVTWSSSDTTIATVNNNGAVRGVRTGAVTVSATTEDGNFTATTRVTVVESGLRVTGISLDRSEIAMIAGEDNEVTLRATVLPSNATNRRVTWSSSDTSVATVNSSGRIRGIKNGTATITATTEDGGFTASCVVSVTFVHITDFTIDHQNTTVNLGIGNTLNIQGWVLPANASNKYGLWEVSDTSIVSMRVPRNSRSPVVFTGLREGTVTVTATALDGGLVRTCTIRVVYIPVQSIVMEREGQTLSVDQGKTVTIRASVLPADSTDKDLVWSSSDPSIAEVSDRGVVRGHNPGRVTITARTKDGRLSKSCFVEVIFVPLTGVDIIPPR
jgi:uncharacterized protein YjdB